MDLFLEIALSFPTVLFTALLAVITCYWTLVLIGAMDIDLLGSGEALDGALDGATEGALEGAAHAAHAAHAALDGAAHGALEGVSGALDGADGALDGAADGLHHGDGALEGATGIFHALGLRRVPITIVFSLVTIFAWLLTYLGARGLRELPLAGPLELLAGGGVALGALVVGMLATSVVIRPLAPLFVQHTRVAEETLIGKVVAIRTTRVDDRFGQAEYDDGGAGILISVVCRSANGLTKGSEALVVGYDRGADRYEVAPYEDPLLEEREGAPVAPSGESARARAVSTEREGA